MNKKTKNIAVIGDGGWGTTLALCLARNNYPVTVWGAFPANIRHIQKTGVNTKFLPGIKLPKKIAFTSGLDEAVNSADILVLSTPSQYLRGVLKKLKKLNLANKIILSVIKGIDTKTLERMSEVITKELNPSQFAVLSGPTIAIEVAKGIPSTAVIASKSKQTATQLQKIFNSDRFRIYTNTDVTGIEIGGSIKNVIALACGVCDGLGYGTNTKSAIMTRGLVEMSRLGKALGAKPKTFSGLAGLGDLVTTCVSPNSRNRSVGEQLGKGKSIKKILAGMNMVAEGVETVKAVYKLSKRHNISMPISNEVYNIIYKGKKPQKAVEDLMARKIKAE
ncbi:MAG: NAD(P)-dependent glycerol-3-phosphate dehydrogenase [Candidatus Omnitrophica bacterium]|nr:NAD(P)-dependent glycerol-3-phosphate dehydrogenase [Candidatus Omnitrophota bacterium]